MTTKRTTTKRNRIDGKATAPKRSRAQKKAAPKRKTVTAGVKRGKKTSRARRVDHIG